MDCNPPGSSAHGISQARILECVSISFSRGSFPPRDRTQVSCIAGRFFNNWATREEGGDICIYIVDPHCCTVETNAVSYSNYTLIEKKKRFHVSTAGSMHSASDWGNKIPHAARHGQKKKNWEECLPHTHLEWNLKAITNVETLTLFLVKSINIPPANRHPKAQPGHTNRCVHMHPAHLLQVIAFPHPLRAFSPFPVHILLWPVFRPSCLPLNI